nr:GDP-fucose protein O-fucosyltransferase 2 isoform X1 [Leptinotarsa decemlineata]
MWFNFMLFFLINNAISNAENACYNDKNCEESNFRYLLYDVNRPEGFNLRRDVYMRFATLAYKMHQSHNPQLKFKLVLPPWSNLIHWGYNNQPEHIPWGLYFDLKSLQTFAPVIEMHEFFNNYQRKYSGIVIDEIYSLQHFEDMFETGNFEDRMKIDKCLRKEEPTFFFYKNITAKISYCLSYHGSATKLTELFLNTTAKIILIDHAEVALHDTFGGRTYWQARRSMRFSTDLKAIAAEFRKFQLNSVDEVDNTVLPKDWTEEKPKRDAIGGPYLAAHLRRRDFVRNRPSETPLLNDITQQIIDILKKLDLNTVFVATDGSMEEFQDLSNSLSEYKVVKYSPPYDVVKKYGDGGVAIIDQIICSYARYFIGTHESTFSFRIQEEREILGFRSETTFNAFCKGGSVCNKPSVWEIVY